MASPIKGIYHKAVIITIPITGAAFYALRQSLVTAPRFQTGGDTHRGLRPDGLHPRLLSERTYGALSICLLLLYSFGMTYVFPTCPAGLDPASHPIEIHVTA